MEPELALATAGFAIVVLLVIIGLPIAWTMLAVGIVGIAILFNLNVVIPHLDSSSFWTTCSYSLAVLPLFVLMGMFTEAARIVEQLFEALSVMLHGLKGGLLHVVVAGSAIFAAATGASMASGATFSRVALPQLLKKGYNKYLSAGCIASSGTMAVMIPPSMAMVTFCILSDSSLGPLLIAGIVPGILNAILLFATVFSIAVIKPQWTPAAVEKIGLRPRLAALKKAPSGMFIVLIITFVLGGIYTGYFTPTQAGAMGAFGTMVIYISRWKKRTLGPMKLLDGAVVLSGKMFFILAGGILFGRFLTLSGLVDVVTSYLSGLDVPRMVILFMFTLLYLVLGQFFSVTAMLVLTVPIVFPCLVALGYNPIWIGIWTVQLCELGTVSPPLGMTVFAVAAASEGLVTADDVFKGAIPLLAVDLALLLLIIFFPQLALWLPSTMM